MWRSIASKSRHVALSFTVAANPYKVPLTSPPQPRFSICLVRSLSNLYVNTADDETAHSNPEIVDIHLDNLAPLSLSSSESVAPDQPSEGLAEEADSLIPGARNVEREIDPDKLENVLSLLQSSTDASLEATLDSMGLELHDHLILRVLETPLVAADNLLRFFIWSIKQPNISPTTSLLDALAQAICRESRKKDAYALWDLIMDAGEKDNSLLTTHILNRLIALFSKLGKGKVAFEVFNKFEDLGCVPDSQTYYYTIEALCRRSFFDWASSVREKMLDAETLPDSDKVGKLICWFCKGGRENDAYMMYLSAKEKNNYPPQPSVNLLISLLCKKNESVKAAAEMLDAFSGSTRKYAIKPFLSVIRGLCRIKDLDGAKILLSKMIDKGPPPGNAVFNSIINAYSKYGCMEEAIEMKKLMVSRGLKPDLFTYTVIMSGYTSGGQMEEACKMLSEAKKKHSKLSRVMYHTLIRGYCKLEQFSKAVDLLAEMKKFGVQVNADEYNKLIQSLCLKALDWEMAEKLLGKMEEDGLHLNGITRSLIRAVKELEEEGTEKVVKVDA